MLYSVRGKLIFSSPGCAVVECGGVGYNCLTTRNTLKTLKPDSEVTLYTYLNVREGAVELYGFATKTELEVFKNLISVSGVGPKAGLSICSALTAEEIAAAVASEDVKSLTMAQGIGKKTAQRIVLELKDKLASPTGGAGEVRESVIGSASLGNIAKAVEALGVLGYTPSEVTPVLDVMDASLPVEQLIAQTLRQMGRN